jgi:hypothetical protein
MRALRWQGRTTGITRLAVWCRLARGQDSPVIAFFCQNVLIILLANYLTVAAGNFINFVNFLKSKDPEKGSLILFLIMFKYHG